MERFAVACVEGGATGAIGSYRQMGRTMQVPARCSLMTNPRTPPTNCFIGLANLPVLAPEYAHHRAGGAELQTRLAKTLPRNGLSVPTISADCRQPEGAVYEGIKTYKAFHPEEGFRPCASCIPLERPVGGTEESRCGYLEAPADRHAAPATVDTD
jgi:hypothetical protein